MNRRVALLPVLATLVLATSAALGKTPDPVSGKVVAIADGDTLRSSTRAMCNTRFDWPGSMPLRRNKRSEQRPVEALASKVFGQIVRVEVTGDDRYRREVGRIYLGDRFINLEMVRDGFA